MLHMMAELSFERYSPRLYVVSSGDLASIDKVVRLEERHQGGSVSRPTISAH